METVSLWGQGEVIAVKGSKEKRGEKEYRTLSIFPKFGLSFQGTFFTLTVVHRPWCCLCVLGVLILGFVRQ